MSPAFELPLNTKSLPDSVEGGPTRGTGTNDDGPFSLRNIGAPKDDSCAIPERLSTRKTGALRSTVAGPLPDAPLDPVSLATLVADGPVQGASYIGGTSYFDRGVVVKRVPTQSNVRTYDPAEGKGK